MAEPPPSRQLRPRRGSLERPLSTRIYRSAWVLVAVPVLVAAFTVGQPDPLPAPALPPSFDQATAVQFATELAQRFPDRSPGGPGAGAAAEWVAARLGDMGLPAQRVEFTAEVPGRGVVRLVNLLAVAPGNSSQAIVVMADRDNLGLSPGANDNASGTAALLELARNVVTPDGGQQTTRSHTLVFVSTDGGAYGELGAAELARNPAPVTRLVGPGSAVIAVVNLDSIAGRGRPRLEFAADNPRSPSIALVTTADASILATTGSAPSRPPPVAQLVDLAFPFTLFGQGPLVAHGTAAVTLTSGGSRPPSPYHDTVSELHRNRLGQLGRAAEALLVSLDSAAEVAQGTQPYVYLGTRILYGWTIQFVLLAGLLPFFAATLDLFARCRRRGIALLPALRSLRSRLGVWFWAGGIFALLALTGVLPRGDARPIPPDTTPAGDWPVGGLIVLFGLTGLGWLVARPRLAPTGETMREDELGGHLAAMLGLAIASLVVAATNPFALIFVLPSLHAWLWLAHVEALGRPARLALYGLGFIGPLFLVLSFALRFDLGFDALWYPFALASLGYVPISLLLALLVWGASAAQVGAIAAGRFAPYPERWERARRGPIRESIRQAILYSRRTRRTRKQDL